MALVVSVSKKVIQEDSLWGWFSAIVDGIYSAQFLHMPTLVLSDSKEHRWAKTAFISGAALLGSINRSKDYSAPSHLIGYKVYAVKVCPSPR